MTLFAGTQSNFIASENRSLAAHIIGIFGIQFAVAQNIRALTIIEYVYFFSAERAHVPVMEAYTLFYVYGEHMVRFRLHEAHKYGSALLNHMR